MQNWKTEKSCEVLRNGSDSMYVHGKNFINDSLGEFGADYWGGSRTNLSW